jgi:hypothetical protein
MRPEEKKLSHSFPLMHMDKKTRLKLIKKAYYDSRRRKRKLTPKSWQLIKELRQENDLMDAADVVVDFQEEDIQEEMQLMGTLRRVNDFDIDWDSARYYDTNEAPETIYFRGPRHLN